MLTVTSSKDESSNCLKLLGLTTPKEEVGLNSKTTSLLATPNDDGVESDRFYSGPSDSTVYAVCQNR